MSFWVWAAVAGLGGVGAVTRFILDSLLAQRLGRDFPFGTLIINLTGAFVLGLLIGAGLQGIPLVLAGTATIGSYTTFSTWVLETQRLSEDGDRLAAAINGVLSLIAGVAVATVGHAVGAHA